MADRDEISSLYRGPPIDSVHLTEGFQRRRLKFEKLTDDGRQTPSDGKSSPCIWQSELNTAYKLVPGMFYRIHLCMFI